MLINTDIETVHLVMGRDGVLQAIFKNKEHALEFAQHFTGATVEPDNLYSAVPKFYGWECRMLIATGEVISTTECTPSFDRVLMQIDNTSVLAVGETKEEAEANATEVRQRLRLIKVKDKL